MTDYIQIQLVKKRRKKKKRLLIIYNRCLNDQNHIKIEEKEIVDRLDIEELKLLYFVPNK